MPRVPAMICGDPANPEGPGLKGNGDPCGNPCSPGHTRCHMHGGHVPQALVKAKTSLALLRLPAIEALYLVVEQLERIVRQATDDLCPHCGYPNWGDNEQNIVIKACARLTQAANAVLDRTDMGPKATLEVKQSDFDIDLKQLIPAEEKEFDDIVANFEAFKARVNQRLHVAAFATLPDDPADDGSSLPPITVN